MSVSTLDIKINGNINHYSTDPYNIDPLIHINNNYYGGSDGRPKILYRGGFYNRAQQDIGNLGRIGERRRFISYT